MGTGTEIYRCLLFAGGDDIYYESEGKGGENKRKALQRERERERERK